jgi:hypothetical protein
MTFVVIVKMNGCSYMELMRVVYLCGRNITGIYVFYIDKEEGFYCGKKIIEPFTSVYHFELFQ